MTVTKPEIGSFKGNIIPIQSTDGPLDLATAKDIAKQKAREFCSDPMLLSFYMGETGEFYPKAECSFIDRPSWIVFAESRGGNMMIDINDGQYVFIYLPLP